MTSQAHTSRKCAPRRRIGPWTLLTMLLLFAVLLPPGVMTVKKWRQMQIQTISVRLTSSGEVAWGEKEVSIAAMRPELQRSVDLLRATAFKPKLLIETYSDTRDADIDSMVAIGHQVGFDYVESARHNWASSTCHSQ